MKVAFCAVEVFPFAKTGGLGDVCGTLPLALEPLGVETVIFLPRYRGVEQGGLKIEPVHPGVSRTVIGKNISVYFIEHKEYFDRDGIYGSPAGDYPDNLERFQYYSAQVFHVLKGLNQKVDILHCHDWHAALIPVYLKELYGRDSFFQRVKSVLTIHNLAHQGVFPHKEYAKLGLSGVVLPRFEFFGKINFLKGGIEESDRVTTVSRRYAEEIQTPEHGCGLDAVLRSRREGITGIVNGLDEKMWDPSVDSLIARRYSREDFQEGKRINKARLQTAARLPVDENVPLFGFVGRLVHQKGMDLIIEMLRQADGFSGQVVILGTGEEKYRKQLEEISRQNPSRFALCTAFNEKLAHQVYAGSDFFLMPSYFEPCGLSQMISLHYGTIPIVRRIGGLADTVAAFDANRLSGNGLVFEAYGVEEFRSAIRVAQTLFHQKDQWDRIRHNSFETDFSWDQSAKQYRDLYQCLLSA